MKVIIISGATATGKSDLAIELATNFGGEVVNFDSLLLYKEINIGTAKPSPLEQRGIPHHMIDVRSISQPMNAADYAREAFPIVERLLTQGKIPYLVGGSGFYLQALIKGMYDSPTTPEEILKRSSDLYAINGISPFRDELQKYDPKSFDRYHLNDHYRIRRAVEHFWTTGVPMSQTREEKDRLNQILDKPTVHNWNLLHVNLDVPKSDHLRIIETRTDRMLKNGLIEEVRGLLSKGFTGKEKPLLSIGYKEAFGFIAGEFNTLAACRERIIISTRQLAKSQRTWFNRDTSREVFNPISEQKVISERVKSFLK